MNYKVRIFLDAINGLSIVGPAVRGEVGSVLVFKGGRERDREREKGGVRGELLRVSRVRKEIWRDFRKAGLKSNAAWRQKTGSSPF